MTAINKDGMLIHKNILLKRFFGIEHGNLSTIQAIIIHQTDTKSAQPVINSYHKGGNGAHFLIDKQGIIYQTASLKKRCYHIGRLIKSKCIALNKCNCKTKGMAKIMALSWSQRIKAINNHERLKSYPDRYPINSDSIGIEVVGKHIDDKSYEQINPKQNTSLQWLVNELYQLLGLTSDDIYKHPEVSYKHPGEASSAKWK